MFFDFRLLSVLISKMKINICLLRAFSKRNRAAQDKVSYFEYIRAIPILVERGLY